MSDDVVTKKDCETLRCSLRREVEILMSENRATVLYEFSEIMDSKMNDLEKKVTDALKENNATQTLILSEINGRTVALADRSQTEQDRASMIQKFVIVILIGVLLGRGWDFIIAVLS